MPVLVVPADTPVGVPLVRALAGLGGEVRAYATGDGDVASLREAGAFVATGTLDDEGRLDAAMTDVHTVISLHADPVAATSAAVLGHHLDVLLAAATNAGVARLVVRSAPGADAGTDGLRAACALVEQRLGEMDLPTVAVRMSLVDTPDLRDALVAARATPGDLPVAPLHVDDVVAALVALDDARGSVVGHATFRLQGPTLMMSDYLDDGRDMVGRVYTTPDQRPLLEPSLGTAWVEPDDGTTADLMDFAGLTPRPLEARTR
jgi:uncharacterized protein YbjT (DUF2867 family)